MNNNPYVGTVHKLAKLKRQLEDHGNIILGVDFDFTLYDSTKPYKDLAFYDDILSLVKRAQASGLCTMCLWTASGDIDGVLSATDAVGLNWDYVNESPLVFGTQPTRKAHFNLLLDDSAGLSEAVDILKLYLDMHTATS